MPGRRGLALAGGALVLLALLAVFAGFNRGIPITLTFGIVRWRGEAVVALYVAVFVGLGIMFLAGLPADLRARRERERLERRARALERRAEARDPVP